MVLYYTAQHENHVLCKRALTFFAPTSMLHSFREKTMQSFVIKSFSSVTRNVLKKQKQKNVQKNIVTMSLAKENVL
jgi:hypothetical protein